jgi:DNA-directed RNA polymerase III subunit RPC1
MGAICPQVKLNAKTIESLQLSVDANSVASAILNTPKLKLKPNHVNVRAIVAAWLHRTALTRAAQVVSANVIHVLPPDSDRMKQVFLLQTLSVALQKVIVQGIPSVERAVINDLGGGRFNLLVEGTNLQAVMGTEGVKATATTTNHVMEAERTLGIEAARNRIIHEINATMQAHGMSIDVRHRYVVALTYQ